MPYIYDMEEIEWPEDGEDLPPPKPEQFQYYSAIDLGGSKELVKFSYTPYSQPIEMSKRRPGILERLFGTSTAKPSLPADQNSEMLLGIMVPALRDMGVVRLYCRYDGGNDEGFAWLDSAELSDGSRLDYQSILSGLTKMGIADQLEEAGLFDKGRGRAQKQLADMVHYWLCDEWASTLLGPGFGTGNYMMYGAFIVDLENCTIADDPKADPVTQNIILGKQDG